MTQADPSPTRRTGTARRSPLRVDLRHGTIEEIEAAVHALLDRADLTPEERIQLLGGAFVVEALRPHWAAGGSPAEAHARLRRIDPELADAVEAIAPMLLGRAYVQTETAAALDAVDLLLHEQR